PARRRRPAARAPSRESRRSAPGRRTSTASGARARPGIGRGAAATRRAGSGGGRAAGRAGDEACRCMIVARGRPARDDPGPDDAAAKTQRAAPEEAERPPAEEPLGEQFLNVVVHDLKTPLTSVRGYAQLAERRLDRGQYEGVRQSLRVIDREVSKMTRMLRNI